MNTEWRCSRAVKWSAVALAVAFTMTACGGGGEQGGGDAAGGGTPAPGAATTPGTTAQGGQAGAQDGDAALIALGDSIFHGQAGGGICFTCHGPDAKGMQGLGPDLTDNTWLNNDGTLEGIMNTVRTGVPQPKEATAPMPPMGGATLNDEQIRAVATYVYSLSHR